MGIDSAALEAAGVSVRLERTVPAGSLRYFDPAGAFAAGVAALLGGPIPAPLSAVRRVVDGSPLPTILVWRSPTETWVVHGDSGCHAALERYAAPRADGCFVDQTGGLVLVTVTGDRAASLLARVAATSTIPAPGQALTGRFADVTATAVCLEAGETFLFVERAHGAHLWGWFRETLADWR
jgi:sarcosine oxidase gamma subunit